MILRELYYFDKETEMPTVDKAYRPSDDESVTKKTDTRKTKLTLGQINRARKASELHTEEKEKELEFVRQMYGIAANAEAGI